MTSAVESPGAPRFAPPFATGMTTRADRWLLAFLLCGLAVQFPLIWNRSINWDEFWFYSQVEQFARGSLQSPLQTLHVRLFAWLPETPGGTVDHIVVARFFMFACEMVTIAAIVTIAERFTDRPTSLLCGAAYLAMLHPFQHGFAFRVDPMAAALGMSALAIIVRSRLNSGTIALTGVLLAVGGMITIKIALYAPAFLGVAWWRFSEAEDRREIALRLIATGMVAMAGFGAIYVLHGLSLDVAEARSGGAVVQDALGWTIYPGVPRYPAYLFDMAMRTPLPTLMLAATPVAIVLGKRAASERSALWGLFLVFATIFVYHNQIAYFYAFLLPPVFASSAVVLASLCRRVSPAIIGAILLAATVVLAVQQPPSRIDRQRVVVGAADEIFGGPVAYFDFCGMLGNHIKMNPFMTTWGMRSYVQAGRPIMREAMEEEVVPLVLAIEQSDYQTFGSMLTTTAPSPYFVPEDAEALRSSYLPFWGPYWVAGKRVANYAGPYDEEFLVPGPYTVKGGAVTVNGREFPVGAVVEIARGTHRLSTRVSGAKLVWGKRLRPPRASPPAQPWWTNFR